MVYSIAIYQPCYFPRLHYLSRAVQSDAFVFLDDVEFSRRSRHHRAEIDFASKRWMTIPVKRTGKHTLLTDAKVDMSTNWPSTHFQTLQHKYGGDVSRFEQYYDRIAEADDVELLDVTIPTLEALFDAFDISADRYRSSELPVERGEDPSAYLLRLVEHLGGETYICGKKDYDEYLDTELFSDNDVDLTIQDWTPRWPDGNVCSLDVLYEADDPRAEIDPNL